MASPVAWGCVHMAVTALQTRLSMRTMGKCIFHFFMAVGAKLGDSGSTWRLRMRVVAGLALDISCVMRAGPPFIGSRFVASAAQLGIGVLRHQSLRMTRLEWPMAGLAGHTFMRVCVLCQVITGGMAFQAGKI